MSQGETVLPYSGKQQIQRTWAWTVQMGPLEGGMEEMPVQAVWPEGADLAWTATVQAGMEAEQRERQQARMETAWRG